jgi:D-glycero-D-manno-heptose 1,7-bisphosphate phosphatase
VLTSTNGWTPAGVSTVFLDRDGVINEKMPEGRYVSSEDDFRILPGVPEAIAKLNLAGIRVVVVSNQRGVALGVLTAEFVERIHARLQQQILKCGGHVDSFYFCPHDKQSCSCRKPLPGLFHQAVKDFPDITPEDSVMIGDSLSDIEFGHGVGMRTIWLEGSPDHRKPRWEEAEALADQCYSSLPEAVDALLAGRRLESSASKHA